MSESFDASRTAIVSEHPPPPDMQHFIDAHRLTEATLVRTDKVDELNKTVLRGGYSAVVFPSLTTALNAIWEGDARFEEWRRAGVRVQFAASPPTSGGPLLAAIQTDYDQWLDLRRRRHAVAGSVLSALALAAAFVIHLG